MEITLQNPNRFAEAGSRRLRPWLLRLLTALVPRPLQDGLTFALRFVGDREMRRTNRQFRGLDKTTDVLSFPGEKGPAGRHLGDVLISVPRARCQALEAGHTVVRELKILALHGVLHCMGYDHEKDDGEMERLEMRLRRAFLTGEDDDDLEGEEDGA